MRYLLPRIFHSCLLGFCHERRYAEVEDDGAEVIGLAEDFEGETVLDRGDRDLPPNFFDGFESNPGRHLRARLRNGMITPSDGSQSGSDDSEHGFGSYAHSSESDPWARLVGISPSQVSHSESERV